MFRFAYSEYLYGLYLIPLFVLFFWYTQREHNKLLENFANIRLHKILFPSRSRIKPPLKFSLVLISIILLIFSLANPQIGSKIEEVKQVGIDAFILLDVSLSMKAEDIKPSRLEKAKHEISKLIQKLRGDRIGLIVFSHSFSNHFLVIFYVDLKFYFQHRLTCPNGTSHIPQPFITSYQQEILFPKVTHA